MTSAVAVWRTVSRARSPHHVYRIFDAHGAVLYVGCTYDVQRRLKEHRYRSPWYFAMASIESEVFPTRPVALAEERRLIAALRPTFNVASKLEESLPRGCHYRPAP